MDYLIQVLMLDRDYPNCRCLAVGNILLLFQVRVLASTRTSYRSKHLLIGYLGLNRCKYCTDGKVYTWGWGGAQGTFSEDGHSSGGQLVCSLVHESLLC